MRSSFSFPVTSIAGLRANGREQAGCFYIRVGAARRPRSASAPTIAFHQQRSIAMNKAADPRATFALEAVHPKPEEAHRMPYAPAVRIIGACDLMFISGATASPLYHDHPHRDDEHVHPHAIEEQTRNAMEAIKSILDRVGASWEDVVKVTKYLTDIRDGD